MALRFHCPHCGTRPIAEWVHGEIVNVPESITDPDQADVDRGFHHDNPLGPVDEVWFHAAGCRRWVPIRRNTADDRID